MPRVRRYELIPESLAAKTGQKSVRAIYVRGRGVKKVYKGPRKAKNQMHKLSKWYISAKHPNLRKVYIDKSKRHLVVKTSKHNYKHGGGKAYLREKAMQRARDVVDGYRPGNSFGRSYNTSAPINTFAMPAGGVL